MSAVTPAAAPGVAIRVKSKRPALVIGTFAGLCFLTAFVTMGLGAVRVPQPHAIEALFGHGTQDQIRTIRDYELPRILMAFLIGGATGAALALLFAPRSGEETRDLISDAAREGARRARDVADRGREIGERAVDRGRRLVDDAAQTVSRQADRVAEGLDKTARTMKEVRDR